MKAFTPEFMETTLRALQKHKQMLENQVAETKREIGTIDEQIQQFQSAIKTSRQNGKVSSEPGKMRRERGANVRQVKAWFDDNPRRGFTMRELQDATGLQNGSIHNVLAKGNNGYCKDEETGKWWRKEDRPQETESAKDDPTPTSEAGASLLGAT
ncbi:MAG: hypothetical protein J4F42_08735 [Desulfurellaceae bacterium]|nr:hypothetical protein [Desulfurellaceae bacterium]